MSAGAQLIPKSYEMSLAISSALALWLIAQDIVTQKTAVMQRMKRHA
jgi:hypothetical protein